MNDYSADQIHRILLEGHFLYTNAQLCERWGITPTGFGSGARRTRSRGRSRTASSPRSTRADGTSRQTSWSTWTGETTLATRPRLAAELGLADRRRRTDSEEILYELGLDSLILPSLCERTSVTCRAPYPTESDTLFAWRRVVNFEIAIRAGTTHAGARWTRDFLLDSRPATDS